MAMMPVWIGSWTFWRATTPGALNSSGRMPSGGDRALAVERLAERVDDAAEERLARTGRETIVPVVRTVSFSLMSEVSPSSTAPTSFSSRLSAMPMIVWPPSPTNSRSSPAMAPFSPST